MPQNKETIDNNFRIIRKLKARECQILQIDTAKECAVFQGKKRAYKTTLHSCECHDFLRYSPVFQQSPHLKGEQMKCKHIYRLEEALKILYNDALKTKRKEIARKTHIWYNSKFNDNYVVACGFAVFITWFVSVCFAVTSFANIIIFPMANEQVFTTVGWKALLPPVLLFFIILAVMFLAYFGTRCIKSLEKIRDCELNLKDVLILHNELKNPVSSISALVNNKNSDARKLVHEFIDRPEDLLRIATTLQKSSHILKYYYPDLTMAVDQLAFLCAVFPELESLIGFTEDDLKSMNIDRDELFRKSDKKLWVDLRALERKNQLRTGLIYDKTLYDDILGNDFNDDYQDMALQHLLKRYLGDLTENKKKKRKNTNPQNSQPKEGY